VSNPANPVSYAADIRPLFRDEDIGCMADYFNLGNYQDVVNNADDIIAHLTGAVNPPMPPDGPWPAEKIALFQRWMADGKKP